MPVKREKKVGTNVRVFLNVPYSDSYEKILVALTAALVALGRVPQLTFQVADSGDGRMPRILKLLGSCRVSVHDLSATGHPVRFNMPFELGLAYAIKTLRGGHDFLVLDRKPHRLDRHLSDLRGIDPKIHNGTARGAVCAILEVLEKPGTNPTAKDVMKLYRKMRKIVPALKSNHGKSSLFNRRIYGELVAMGFEAAENLGL